jgi:hypothetical protein
VVQPGGGAGLTVEDRELGIVQPPPPEQLDGHQTREDLVSRLEYPGEAAVTNLPDQLEPFRKEESRHECDPLCQLPRHWRTRHLP